MTPRRMLVVLLALCLAVLSPAGAWALNVGDKAPLFKANSNRGQVSLEDYLGGKYVVLAFYFAINTPA